MTCPATNSCTLTRSRYNIAGLFTTLPHSFDETVALGMVGNTSEHYRLDSARGDHLLASPGSITTVDRTGLTSDLGAYVCPTGRVYFDWHDVSPAYAERLALRILRARGYEIG